jgi:hypothetical protein
LSVKTKIGSPLIKEEPTNTRGNPSITNSLNPNDISLAMKGGKPSVSPWGKPIKDGFKTVVRNLKKQLMTQYVWIQSLHTLHSFPLLDKRRYGSF